VIARSRFAYLVKRFVARTLYTVGVLQLMQAVRLRRRAVVLMYHRVLTADERRTAGSHPALIVDRDTFERQMACLKRRFAVMSVADLAAHVEAKRPFPPSACIITFDDGWRDNYDNALPVLARFQLPSLIFLPMNFIGQRRVFWQEALVQLLGQALGQARSDSARRAAIDTVLAPVGLSGVLDITEPDAKPRLIEIVTEQKKLTRERIDQLVDDLARVVGVPLEALASVDGFIDWSHVASMSRQGVTFGGHGIDHLLLTKVADDKADAEVIGSKRELDARLRESVPTFSYPNGYWTPRVVEQVKRVGYRLAFIAQGGPVTCDDDPWTLSRVNIHETATNTEPLFLARLVGLF
jgi:peptidoglycan/xylan/chitin deacetylase (PgdA/CDA1 family)